MKTVFRLPQRRNLAQTNAFGDILLDGIFPLKQGFHLFTFSEKPNGISMILRPFWALFACDVRTHGRTDGRTEDKPAQRDPLHALGTHPVCGRCPSTPIPGELVRTAVVLYKPRSIVI